MTFRWSHGNAKLRKNRRRTVGFTLPALRSDDGFVTCPAAGICAGYCFGRQGRMVLGAAAAAYEHNLRQVRYYLDRKGGADTPRLAAAILRDLAAMPTVEQVRINVLGDFFSQAYLDTWVAVAGAAPTLHFYAYTKQHARLDFSRVPDNMVWTQSLGGKDDAALDASAPHSRVFVSMGDLRKAGYRYAGGSDDMAARGEHKQGLVYHGTRRLTDGQVKHLRVLP